MRKELFVAAAFLTLCAGVGTLVHAQNKNAKDVVADVARTIGATNLKSIQYSATGYTAAFGLHCHPGKAWPKFALTRYTRAVEYETPASEERLRWTQFEGETCGGGYIPMRGELDQNILLSGDSEWSYGTNPHPLLTFSDSAMRAVSRQMQIAMTPAGWVKAAMAANPTMESKTIEGKKMTVISFTWKNKYKMNGYVNDQNLLEKAESWLPQDMLGDMLVEAIYSDYRDYSGVKFPTKIVRKEGGFPVLDLTITEVHPNAPVNIVVPSDVRNAPPPREAVLVSRRLGDGVWSVAGSPVVEFKDYVAVIEPSGNEARSLAVMEEVKRIIPNKPIRYVINTHSHLSHNGGIRTFVAEGVTIITSELNKPYFEELFKLPFTMAPDKLSKNPKPAKFIAVKDKYILTDGTQSVEVYAVPDNAHSADMLIAYIPRVKTLVARFMSNPPDFIPLRADAFVPAIGLIGAKQSLLDHIRELKLDVRQISTGQADAEIPLAMWQNAVDIEKENLRRLDEERSPHLGVYGRGIGQWVRPN